MRPAAAFVCSLAAGLVPARLSRQLSNSDWRQVRSLAERHQVDALCGWRLRASEDPGSLGLPAALGEGWKLAYLHHRLRNEALTRDLERLTASLATRGIPALYFKGPWMAFRAYPDPGTRPVGDIDLCVRETHYRGAIEALRIAGWHPTRTLPETPAEALLESHYRRQLRFTARGRRPVELHFRLLNMGPPGPPEDWLWETSRQLAVGPVRLRVPGPEAMLLHLLLHANQHGFAVLRLLHDIRWALAADQEVLDMQSLLHRVRCLGCAAACYHALQLAAELTAASPPVGFEALRPSLPRRKLFSLLWRLQAARRLRAKRRCQEMESPLFYLLEMGRWSDKARYAWRVTAALGGPLHLARKVLALAAIQQRRTQL